MKLIRFEWEGANSVGVARGDSYVDLDALLDTLPQGDNGRIPGLRGSMRQFLEFCSSPGAAESLTKALASLVTSPQADKLIRRGRECRLLAPINDPGKIICLGQNYAAHAAEQGKAPPEVPMIFAKFASSIIGPGENVALPSRYTQQVDYEVELAVVIGRRGKEIPQDQALHYVAGYTILNDVTARDFQAKDKQWVRAKSCDTFAPLGPHIVTADEIRDPNSLHLELRLNGQVMQSSSTSHMVFNVPFLISYLSRCMTLEPGDIISTGTPPGVGVHRNPPVFLQAGDQLEAEVEQIGTLANSVVQS